jgi:8-oxo-dGTP diphosphatase
MKAGVDYIGITTPFFCHDENLRFLMHKRSDKCRDEHFRWDFGGGQLDFGEEIEDCVLRELFEEYGCSGEIIEQLPAHSLLRKINGVDTHWLVIPFIIKVNPQKVSINEPEKILELGWFTLDKLPEPLHSGAQATLKRYREIFEKYIRV